MANSIESFNYVMPPELKARLDRAVNPPSFSDASGTAGAATQNTATGLSAVALGASAVVITNNLCTANSVVMAMIEDLDTTALYVRRVLPANGSFTITVSAAANADTNVRWYIVGA